MNDFTVLDIETTGLRLEECEITELAAVRVRGGVVVDRRDPGGEKVVYSMLALMFGALAVMPWLPPGNRYCRAMTNMRKEVAK